MVHLAAQDIDQLLARYGYWAVLVFVMIESIGIPIPGETMLIAAGIYAGATHNLQIGLTIAAAAAGAILGDNLGYTVGREGGVRRLRRYGRYGRYIRLDDRKLKLGQDLFRQRGGKVNFFRRFVSILRAWAAFLAGVNRMPWPRFIVYNAAGGILWATLYGLGAYALGANIHRFVGPIGLAIGLAAGIVIIAALVLLWKNEQRLEDEAVRAIPGSLDAHR